MHRQYNKNPQITTAQTITTTNIHAREGVLFCWGVAIVGVTGVLPSSLSTTPLLSPATRSRDTNDVARNDTITITPRTACSSIRLLGEIDTVNVMLSRSIPGSSAICVISAPLPWLNSAAVRGSHIVTVWASHTGAGVVVLTVVVEFSVVDSFVADTFVGMGTGELGALVADGADMGIGVVDAAVGA